MKYYPFLLFCGFILYALVAEAKPAQSKDSVVTIPIKEYLELRRINDFAKVTSVEEIRLEGSYGKDLSLTFKGRCSGGYMPKEVLKLKENISLSQCKGNAILDSKDYRVSLVPLAKEFKLTCKVQAKNWNEFEVQVLNAFSFKSKVTGAEILTETLSGNTKKIALIRKQQITPGHKKTEITGTAKYHITILPEQTSFRYYFQLNNPNRGTQSYKIAWLNGETIQRVRGIANYEESEKHIKLTLSPGANRIYLTGRYANAQFQPLLKSEQQYLLVESHPTLRLDVKGQGRRISVNDDVLSPTFTNARLYLFGKKGSFQWSTKKLEVMQAMGYSVDRAAYRYYVPESGRPVVEATFNINNQGMPEIPLEIPGTATYLEVEGQPQVLYKSPEGKLLVQVPPGKSSISLQYQLKNETSRFLASHGIEMTKPDAVLSNVSVSLLTPAKWKLLYGIGLLNSQSDFPPELVFWAFALALLLFFAPKLWGFGKTQRLVMAIAGFIMGILSPVSLLTFGGLFVVLLGVRYRMAVWNYVRKLSPVKAIILVLVIGVPAMIMFLVAGVGLLGTSRGMMNKTIGQYENFVRSAEGGKSQLRGAGGSMIKKSKAVYGESEALDDMEEEPYEDDADSFQGLPAKINIPDNVHWTSFNQSMVDQKGRIRFRGILVSRGTVGALYMVLLMGIGLMLLARRKKIYEWAKSDVG